MTHLIPKKMFFTKGVGNHRNKLQSFELALRNCGIEQCNLVYVSSIFPPNCKIISKAEGIKLLLPGQITFVVMAKASTNEPNRLVAASIGLAQPKDKNQYGYISEHHSFGETQRKVADFAEDLAATMLASTLGIELDADKDWNERKQLYVTNENQQFKSRSIAQTAEGHKNGLWTTVIACAVMIIE
jgi:arginine decarboxylase